MEDKIVYVPVSVDLKAQTKPTADSIVIFDNGEMRLFSEVWPIAIATSYLKPTPLSELLKEKDEQIKELVDMLDWVLGKVKYYSREYCKSYGKSASDSDKYLGQFYTSKINKIESILQKHNSIV